MEYRNPKDLKPHPISTALYGENNIEDIKESIEQLGILVPLIITEGGLIISGHRRWRSALELCLTTIPVEVKVFANDLAEKQSILDFNKQREKSTSQKVKEGKLTKEIESEKAKQRQGTRIDQSIMDKRPLSSKLTRDIVAKKVDLGSGRTFARAERIYDKAQEGDAKAQELIKEIDAEETTIYKAYTELFDKPHVSHNTGENEWYTPKPYTDAAHKVMGSIDLDPASSDIANKTIGATTYFTIQDDGRKKEWSGNIWMNPPYAQPLVAEFCDLLVENYKGGKIRQACVLVNNATETSFYQNMLAHCAAVCFIKGRVKFIDEKGNSSGAPLQGQTILYFGENRDKFKQYFEKFGVILYVP